MNECIQRAVRRALTASHIRIQPAARRVVVAAATADDVRATNGQQTRLTRPDPGDFIDLAACDHGVGLHSVQFHCSGDPLGLGATQLASSHMKFTVVVPSTQSRAAVRN